VSDTDSSKHSKIDSLLVQVGRKLEWTKGIVNPVIYRASTVLFPTLEQKERAEAAPDDHLFYGRRGTPTIWALENALTELEQQATGTVLTPSGLSAVTLALLSVVKAGDHLLVTDAAYGPTRSFCTNMLKDYSVECDFYDPGIGSGIAKMMRPNTRAVLVESPGSLTMDLQDIPAISEVAHSRGAVVIADNCWATPVFCQSMNLGVDITAHPLTKYVGGHSDIMLGAVSANEENWPRVKRMHRLLGLCAGPDDIFLALRGIRTLAVRLQRHESSALKIAQWLEGHAMVDQVLHPALPSFPRHDLWKRDFSGSSGLFSFVIKPGIHNPEAMVNDMQHFSIGFSWGGYESLIMPFDLQNTRIRDPWPERLKIRLHVGLEDVDDLIQDLADGLDRLNKTNT